MDAELMLDVGQANEFKLACRRAGYTNADVKRLCEGEVLAHLLPVVRGHAEVTVVRHLIDCDADPFGPEGSTVAEHRISGQLEWDPTKLELYLSLHQQGTKCIEGNKLREELAAKPVANANVLDYLLKHPHLIPEEWKDKAIFFWGTIYRNADGYLCVRYLDWDDGYWDWDDGWLGSGWDAHDPAVLLAG